MQPLGAGALPDPTSWLLNSMRGRSGNLATFTFLSGEWDNLCITDSKPSCHWMRMWGNMKAEHYLDERWLAVTIAVNKFNCTAHYSTHSGETLIYTSAENLWACLERGRNFTWRNDRIFSQALGCFINACLIWGKRKTGWGIRGSFTCRELAMFWNKKQLLRWVLMASLSHFPSPAAALPRKEGRSWGTVVPSPAAGLKQGGFRINLGPCAHLWQKNPCAFTL